MRSKTKQLIEQEFGTGIIEREFPGYGRIVVNHWKVVQEGPRFDRFEEESTTEVAAFALALGVPGKVVMMESAYSLDIMEDMHASRAVLRRRPGRPGRSAV